MLRACRELSLLEHSRAAVPAGGSNASHKDKLTFDVEEVSSDLRAS